MHDATECGIWGALYEMAAAAELGLVVDKASIVTQEIVLDVCRVFDIDPHAAISEGTLVAAVDPTRVGAALAALDAEGIPASVVGELTEPSTGVRVVDEDGEHELVHPKVDPFWLRFEEYLRKQTERGESPASGG